jgi:condensin-2 complex subunit D3
MAHPTNAEQDLVTPCVLLLNSLALHSVSNAWVDSIWDGQFTESQELPMDYVEVIQGVEVKEVFARLQELTIKWIKVHKQEEDSTIHSISLYRVGFWTIMSEQNIKLKVLVALLYHYMERGQKMASGDQERQLAIQAAGLYLVLIGLPGSETFEIFHPRLYTKALDTFMMVKELGLDKKSPNKKGVAMKDAQPSQQSGIQASQDGDKEEEEGMAALSQREVGKVLEGLVEVLNCLHIMLDNCSLKMSLESIEVTVGSLVTLTHLETTISEMDFVGWNRNTSVSSLAVNAYLGLAKVCSPLHGEGAGGVAEVLKGLLPGVLMIGEKPTKVLEVIRAHTLRFIRFLMVGGGQAACRAASVLVQHMAAKVHNKVEFRREAAEAIVSLMGALPEDLFSSTVRWFVR